jgi:integrase
MEAYNTCMAAKPATSKTPIQDFLDGTRTKGTAGAYRGAVLLFLDVMYDTSREGGRCRGDEFEKYEKLAYRYLREKRDHKADLITFVKKMQTNSAPSKTIKVKMTGVREFFIKYDIVIDDKAKREIKKILPMKFHRETNYEYMTLDKLQTLLPHLDIRLKAMVLCLVSSGCRIGELLTLNINDLKLDENPATFFIRETKTGVPRKAYLTPEAVAALKAWFSVREEYFRNINDPKNPQFKKKSGEDRRVFPFNKAGIYRQYDKALVKSGLYHMDDRTNRNTLNIHRMRAFFRETVAPIIGADAAEMLIGHSDEYENAYRGLSEEKLASLYLQCTEALTVSNNQRIEKDLKVQAAELKEQSNELLTLRAKVQQLAAENEELRKAPVTNEKSLQAQIDLLKSMIDAMAITQNVVDNDLPKIRKMIKNQKK